MITVESLTKRYGRFMALRGITFQAESGEILGFLGPNGAGKTTTMRILTGYMPPTSGRASVAGYDVFTDSLEMRKCVGYLPETVPLYPDMTVHGYVKYVAELRGVPHASSRADDVLRIVGMHTRRDSLIRSISKGMRQRVGLAQALVHDPPVLILDEPTIGLDPRQTLEVRDLVRSLGKTHTIMFSTHILSEAEQVCDRVVIIHRGEIVAMDKPEALRDQLQKSARLFVRVGKAESAEAVRKALQNIAGVASVTALQDGFSVEARRGVDVRPRIASAITSAGWELLELRPLAMSLEDIFLELTVREGADERL
ncbi:MAG: MFS transporter [Candidatus Thermofonsia Clade 1 bacterium]|uniref:MFS transporter n=1 Tax=Candidatus Thermofonsia Clade 1 bacterium TaxID=2364210 RepID=A0A2M8NZ89_9CHLR|nr:MAG: MFS transporter [Candidatus Thermofonsia Clade 1 bacterium]